MQIPNNWTFATNDIAKNFDRHVREQLPWYDLATGVIAHIARHYIPENGMVYDIGCSTGNIGIALSAILKDRSANIIGIDKSEAMRSVYLGGGEFVCVDATTYEYKPFDLGVCFLSIMFIEIHKRQAFLNKLKSQLRPGGAIIVFDRSIPKSGYVSLVMSRLILSGKIATGTPAEEILAKELSLIGVQRPIDENMLMPCTEIFRFGDFAGWIIEKENI